MTEKVYDSVDSLGIDPTPADDPALDDLRPIADADWEIGGVKKGFVFKREIKLILIAILLFVIMSLPFVTNSIKAAIGESKNPYSQIIVSAGLFAAALYGLMTMIKQ